MKKGSVYKKTDAFVAFFNSIIQKMHCQWNVLNFYHIKGFVLQIKHNFEAKRIFMESLYTDLGAYATINIRRKFTCTCQKSKRGTKNGKNKSSSNTDANSD